MSVTGGVATLCFRIAGDQFNVYNIGIDSDATMVYGGIIAGGNLKG